MQGALDRIRLRAESALGKGVEPDQAALARGFVLGADDRIDPLTSEQFRRAGLSHLLAVSGQNVILLALLAGTALAVFGVGLRTRLLITVLLIAVYVPVAGGGPSIQRAGSWAPPRSWPPSQAGRRTGPIRRCSRPRRPC